MSPSLADFRLAVDQSGFAIVSRVIGEAELTTLTEAVARVAGHLDGRGGARDVFRLVPEVARLAVSPSMWPLAEAILGPDPVAVRALLFDRRPGANWKVSWHQDVTIAVKERRELAGFEPWTAKAGIPHVQPPATVLKQMLTLRLHLDPCGPANGPVRVLPGSHQHGRLSGAQIDQWRTSPDIVECVAQRGDVLAMRPLLLHASSAATSPAHRRVIHLEYAASVALPRELEWHEGWHPQSSRSSAA